MASAVLVTSFFQIQSTPWRSQSTALRWRWTLSYWALPWRCRGLWERFWIRSPAQYPITARTRWGRRRPFILGGAVDRRAVTSFDLDASRCHPDGTFPLSPADSFGLCSSLFGLFRSVRSAGHPAHHELRRTHACDGLARLCANSGNVWIRVVLLVLSVTGLWQRSRRRALAWRDRGSRYAGGSRSNGGGLQGKDGDVCQAT